MAVPNQLAQRFAEFPAKLQELVEAELAAGNEIVEICNGFPAPPVGACLKLAKLVTTQPRQSGSGLDFYERNTSSYSGEFTDEKRFFFVLEPPKPPEPEPDMNAIRAAMEARQRAADAAFYEAQKKPKRGRPRKPREHVRSVAPKPAGPPAPPHEPVTTLERFEASMVIDYDKWHDGIGYDIDIINQAAPEELVEIENLLVNRGVSDWRDVEALAALNSPRAKVLLRKALQSHKTEIRTAVIRHAPDLLSNAERTELLVNALQRARSFEGLDQTLQQVEAFHPPEVIHALLRGVLERDGETAVHYAAMLMFLHGKAESSFDWEQRPFFLQFNTDHRAEREKNYRELCAKIGVEPGI